ncbi:MAG: response regulator [Spirochaetales bacterium]|nr:response regulator [Spirochaetales bacterium]
MAQTIMVVDDSNAIRQSVTFILRENGYETMDAFDGQNGLDKLKDHKVDLIITDVNMPNMDGIAMIRELRQTDIHKFTPILVLTTESQSSIMQEGKGAGATGWIVKPFTNEKLIATIKKVIG